MTEVQPPQQPMSEGQTEQPNLKPQTSSRRDFLRGAITGVAGLVVSEAAGLGLTSLFDNSARTALQPKTIHTERQAPSEPKILRVEDVKGDVVRELHGHPYRFVGEGAQRKPDFSIDDIVHPTDHSTVRSINTMDGHSLIAFQVDPQTLMKYQDGTVSAVRFEYNTYYPSDDSTQFPDSQYVADIPIEKVLTLLNAENKGKSQGEQRLTIFMGNKQPLLEQGYDNVIVVPTAEIIRDNQLSGAGVSVSEVHKGLKLGTDGQYTLDQQGEPTLVVPFFDLQGGSPK